MEELRRGHAGLARWTVQLAGGEPEVVTGDDPDALLDAARARGSVVRTRERSFLIGTLVTIAIVAAVIVLPVLQTGGKVRLRAALKAGSGT